ncbi:hypothetical protein RchiOBHm_Chr6g0306271 [Rosa chinensis]|uniref:Uncharacterized protein n=1 Tax=Rosa chinensis TaxID=74649 RepID=A0A2P6Q066_ROSCH|nr:hypothetical protein RchiOBHm_Chr6g0306271 [Rosa chinensis]
MLFIFGTGASILIQLFVSLTGSKPYLVSGLFADCLGFFFFFFFFFPVLFLFWRLLECNRIIFPLMGLIFFFFGERQKHLTVS